MARIHEQTSDRLAQLETGEAPNWTTRYQIGVQINKPMDCFCSLDEIASELGISRQNAYTETVLALGTLACRLHARLTPRRDRRLPT